MIGALSTGLLVALFTLMALRPPMPRHSTPFNLQFALGYAINELPFLGLWWLLWGTLGTLMHPQFKSVGWWLVAGLVALNAVTLAWLLVRARSARPALSAALETTFGAGTAPHWTRPSWWRMVLIPIIAWRPDVRRVRNRRYGPARRGNQLDVYISRRRRRSDAPVLVYLHGGGFFKGTKMLGAHSLLYRLAAQGWVCISADYRLSRASYSDQLADTRAALAWARANAKTYGGDPGTLFAAGGSVGAHLVATAALSGTEVSGVIGLYGYYGQMGPPIPESTSPHDHINRDAPPFLVVHGALDTLVLATDARRFADELRAVSRHPVAHAELPGAQHNFDFFPSLRFHAVTDAVLRFAELSMSADRLPPSTRRPSAET